MTRIRHPRISRAAFAALSACFRAAEAGGFQGDTDELTRSQTDAADRWLASAHAWLDGRDPDPETEAPGEPTLPRLPGALQALEALAGDLEFARDDVAEGFRADVRDRLRRALDMLREEA